MCGLNTGDNIPIEWEIIHFGHAPDWCLDFNLNLCRYSDINNGTLIESNADEVTGLVNDFTDCESLAALVNHRLWQTTDCGKM